MSRYPTRPRPQETNRTELLESIDRSQRATVDNQQTDTNIRPVVPSRQKQLLAQERHQPDDLPAGDRDQFAKSGEPDDW